jgi:hypothetical protein
MNKAYELAGILPVHPIDSHLEKVIFLFISEEGPLDPFPMTCEFGPDGSIRCTARHTKGDEPTLDDMQPLLDAALEGSTELLRVIEQTLSLVRPDPSQDVR